MDGAVSGKPPDSKDGLTKDAYVIMIIVVDKL